MTWEQHRQRWVFQMRIPVPARPAFGGRTTVRHHLGNLPPPDAIARAGLLAAHYRALFDPQRKPRKGPCAGAPAAHGTLRVFLDTSITRRFIATWRTEQCRAFEARLKPMRQASNADWERLEEELSGSLARAREELRRHDRGSLRAALASIEAQLDVRIEGGEEALNALSQAFNGARVAFLSDCLAVVHGDTPILDLVPDPAAQLPLVGLWGDPASRLTQAWEERLRAVGDPGNPKTRDKYRAIAADLGAILTRRPVQSLTQADLDALKHLWSARGNGPGTVKDKLRILRSLLRPFDPQQQLEALFAYPPSNRRAGRAARLPFTDAQIRGFIDTVMGSQSVREDDQMLLALLILLGTRLEEVYQLRAEDFEANGEGWLVRFADHRQTGVGDAHLKNAASARRLPLRTGVFPRLDVWVRARVEAGGYVFAHGSTNKYGVRSAAAGRRLNRLLRTLYPHDRRLVLQSTRSTANRVMRRADTDPRIRRRFLGHADTGIHDRHYDPGELLDDQDLEAGSAALADFLRDVVRVEDGATVQALVHPQSRPAEHGHGMAYESFGARPKQ
ncbi:MAG: hypothetical protein ACYC18_14875 [Gammaproteobacteria bacterium]